MKKVHIERKELKKTINDLEKASETFFNLGCYYSTTGFMQDDEEKEYGKAGLLLAKSIKTLKIICRNKDTK